MKNAIGITICLVCCLFSKLEAATRVYVDIVGDLFHAGHVEFLKHAKSFGDYLVVGVLADDVVEGYKRQPVISLEDRVKVIGACKYVDEVVVAPPPHLTKEMIEALDIQFIVHGDDISEALMQEHYRSAIDLDIFRLIPYTPGISTTSIIQSIVDRADCGEFR